MQGKQLYYVGKCELKGLQVPGTVAITFDDGPYNFTSHILDLLDSYGAKATFFISGNNIGKGQIDIESNGWSAVIKRMHNSGHQIASHTWSHQDLSTLPKQQLRDQIYSNEMALRNILGFFPQYMRPPYSSCTALCQEVLESTGYHIIYFDLDSEDYLHDDPIQIQVSKNDITGNLSMRANPSQNHWLVIEHDTHQQTAYNLTEHTLQQFKSKGFRMVTVGECLGDDRANWYRREGDEVNPTNLPRMSSPVSSPPRMPSSTNGPIKERCGVSFGSCNIGTGYDCCSSKGWW
jgi:peptidoglycan/xylan/chitin deacetylase (PgdA/CDA1 family)